MVVRKYEKEEEEIRATQLMNSFALMWCVPVYVVSSSMPSLLHSRLSLFSATSRRPRSCCMTCRNCEISADARLSAASVRASISL